jgi:hypothetical protein
MTPHGMCGRVCAIDYSALRRTDLAWRRSLRCQAPGLCRGRGCGCDYPADRDFRRWGFGIPWRAWPAAAPDIPQARLPHQDAASYAMAVTLGVRTGCPYGITRTVGRPVGSILGARTTRARGPLARHPTPAPARHHAGPSGGGMGFGIPWRAWPTDAPDIPQARLPHQDAASYAMAVTLGARMGCPYGITRTVGCP